MEELLASESLLPTKLASQKALHIAEIQDRVLSFADDGDCARFVRVSQAMKDVALDHIWHTVDGLDPLLRILFNVDKSQNLSNLSQRLKPSHWDRFSTFASRIKVLCAEKKEPHDTGSASAWNEVLRSRPEIRILPNLKGLYIYANSDHNLLQYAVLFLHKNLKTILFQVNSLSDGDPDLEVFLDEIAIRAPRLKRIYSYLTGYNSTIIPEAFSRCLARQMSLTDIDLLSGTLTAMLIKSLSTLPNLASISIDKLSGDTSLQAIENIDFARARGGNVFQSLQHLDIQTRLASAKSLLSSHSGFASLRILKIDMISHNSSQDVQSCLRVISKMCPMLEHLALYRDMDDGNRPEVLELETDALTKDVLAPLASLIHLQHFELIHTQPITVSDDEFVELLACCPPLKELHLNPSPIQAVQPASRLPSLAVLHRIAQCQPKLKQLSLFLDTSYEEGLEIFNNITVLANPFAELEILSVGKSVVDDIDRVALYMSQVLPQECEIDYDEATTGWAEVIEKLQLLTMFCSSQRQRIRELERMLELSYSDNKRLSALNATPNYSSDTLGPESD